MKKIKAVVLDIDGTLSPEVSWLALTRDLGASIEEHIAIYKAYKTGQTDYIKSKAQLLSLWESTGNANYDFFHKLFVQLPLDDNAISVTASLKSQYDVCIITGSMDMYAEIVAKKLGVDKWYANTSLYWSNDLLTDMDYELDQATKKLEQFLGFCIANGYEPDECIVVGDSDNDLTLFDASKRGVLVGKNLSDELKQHAWKTIPSLGSLQELLS